MTILQYNFTPWLTPVRVVQTANLAGTYNNGSNGVGATLTGAATTLTIDGVAVSNGDRVLLMAQTSGLENGIYVVSGIGSNWVLTRSDDMNDIENMLHPGLYVTVGAGTLNAGSAFVLTEPLPAQIGVSNIVFTASPLNSSLGTAATKAASNNALATVASVSGATVVGHIAAFSDVSGTIESDVATAINSGDIQAGIAGTPGRLISMPNTAGNGSLIIDAIDAGGAFNTTISNSTMGQASVVSIPDPGGATANFLLSANAATQHVTSGSLQVDAGGLLSGLAAGGTAGSLTLFSPTGANGSLVLSATDAGGNFDMTLTNSTLGQDSTVAIVDPVNANARLLVGATATPFVSGEFPVASGTGGLMVSSGVAASNLQNKTNIIAKTSADIGGAGAGPITIAEASLTAASVVVATVESSTNPVSVIACTAGAGSFNVTFSADPGAACLINYVAFVAAQ